MALRRWCVFLLSGVLHGQVANTGPGDALFDDAPLLELRIELGEAALKTLHGTSRGSPRPYVVAMLREAKDGTPRKVGLKLKGSWGSFRSVTDKPGLTIDVDRYVSESSFHGLVRFHLNNSVQDGSYLREYLAYDLFRRAGYPAPRATHAKVWINGQDKGLYVVKETYDEKFLSRWFQRADGNLYDGGTNGEIHHENLERDSGAGPLDRRDLKELTEAISVADPEERLRKMGQRLDIERFLTFMALEIMVGHWDGYTLNPNNYRLYFEPGSGQAVFIPHGVDQVLQRPDAPISPRVKGRVAVALLSRRAEREALRTRIEKLLPLLHPPESTLAILRRQHARVRSLAERTSTTNFLERLDAEVARLEAIVRSRARYLADAIKHPGPKPFVVGQNGVTLAGLPWTRRTECKDAVLEEAGKAPSRVFRIRAGACGRCVASFRTQLLLPRGRYELRTKMTMEGVVPADSYNPGAGVRISHGRRSEVFSGSHAERSVRFSFEVNEEESPIVIVLELRASQGEVVFPEGSLELHRR